jgi:flagellar basal-body rod modification protein FlgD
MKVDAVTTPPQQQAQQNQGPNDRLDKQDFLELLTIQLSQQDPLNPMDNQAFIAQLSQLATVERLENMSASMESMAMAQAANTSAQIVGFIGQEVVVDGADIAVADGKPSHEFGFNLTEDAAEIEVIVRNEDGEIVRTMKLEGRDAGEHAVDWDGKDDDGSPVADGKYTFEVHATDTDGEKVAASTQSTRKVTGVTYEDGFPRLLLQGGGSTALGKVKEVTNKESAQ